MIKKANFAVAALVASVSFLPAAACQSGSLATTTSARTRRSKGEARAGRQSEGGRAPEFHAEHMQMMQQTTDQMQAIKPQAGMTTATRELDQEHQKLMDDML